MPSPTVLRRCFVFPLLAGALLVGTASAHADGLPLTEAQVAQWKTADVLLAQSDLVGARAAITPLIPVAATLPDGAERAWLDRTLASVLYLTDEDAARRTLLADLARLVKARPAEINATGWLPTPTDTARGGAQGCTVQGSVVFDNHHFPLDWTDPNDVEYGQFPFVDVMGPVDGLPSYTAGDTTFSTWPTGTLAHGTACNLIPVRYDGGAARGWKGSVSVAATDPIVATRRIAARGTLQVQVFTPHGRTLIADWQVPSKQTTWTRKAPTSGKIKLTAGVHTYTVHAPKRRGRYRLELFIDKRERTAAGLNHVTDVTDIGVGVKPKSEHPAYVR